jgi:hypothetical protein
MGGLTTLVRKNFCKGRFKNIDQYKFTEQVENYGTAQLVVLHLCS